VGFQTSASVLFAFGGGVPLGVTAGPGAAEPVGVALVAAAGPVLPAAGRGGTGGGASLAAALSNSSRPLPVVVGRAISSAGLAAFAPAGGVAVTTVGAGVDGAAAGLVAGGAGVGAGVVVASGGGLTAGGVVFATLVVASGGGAAGGAEGATAAGFDAGGGLVPAVVVTIWFGEKGTGQLLILSQVVLSLQLPFAVVPLVMFTASRAKMGPYVAPRWLTVLAVATAMLIIGLNAKLVLDVISG